MEISIKFGWIKTLLDYTSLEAVNEETRLGNSFYLHIYEINKHAFLIMLRAEAKAFLALAARCCC